MRTGNVTPPCSATPCRRIFRGPRRSRPTSGSITTRSERLFRMGATIVWFRQDLRLQDNPALFAAWQRGGAIIPVYIWDEAGAGRWPPGAASRWWLHHSLKSLDKALRARGSRLVLRQGATDQVLHS